VFVFINVVFVVEEAIFSMSRPIIIATTFCREKAKPTQEVAIKLVFVQSSFADEKEWDCAEWLNEKNLRHAFLENREEVCFHDIKLSEDKNLLALLNDEVLEEVNKARSDDNLSEIVLENTSALSFLSLNKSWTNIKYSDAINLDISKPQFKKRVIVIKTQNPCK